MTAYHLVGDRDRCGRVGGRDHRDVVGTLVTTTDRLAGPRDRDAKTAAPNDGGPASRDQLLFGVKFGPGERFIGSGATVSLL